jgi:hypothetical protein
MTEEVKIVNDHLITYEEAFFGNGYNVYRRLGDNWIKANPRAHWFKTLADAERFANDQTPG